MADSKSRFLSGTPTAALLPCPFCGNTPEVFPSGDGTGTMIECVTEGCVGPHTSYYGVGIAQRVWNKRAAQSSLTSQLSAMEAAKNAAMTLAHEREAEIKRLQHDLDNYIGIAGIECNRAEAAEAEVARLREALDAILVDCTTPSKPDFTDADCKQRCSIIARAALAQSPGPK